MAAQAALGQAALDKSNYLEAITQYTAALHAFPTSPDYYIKRSMAYQRSSPPNYEAALSDASVAVIAATKRARRELIVQAQLRRAVALYGLKRYADAKFCFEIVQEMDPKEKQLPIWFSRIDGAMKGLEPDDERARITVERIPNVDIPSPEEAGIKDTKQSETKTINNSAAAVVQTPPSKIKHEYYQNQSKIFLSLLAKGVPKDKTVVDIQERSINISFPTLDDGTFDFSLDPLYEPIDPSKSTFRITPSKIELTLEKAFPKKWPTLETNEPSDVTPVKATSDALGTTMKQMVLGEEAKAPVYPTSSKRGPTNWDKLADDMDVDKEGDNVTNFFQSLYKDADPEVKRAMMKSYQESNGTVLSTNWAEVGAGKVETSPPDGMVAKKWDE
jgi:suppressor of G2 allele of SKP1